MTIQYLVTPAIAYLNTSEFNELLSDELNKIEFIMLEWRISFTGKCTMGSKTKKHELQDGAQGDEFDKFVNACFECHVLDENSISKSTLEYLHWCGIIRYPKPSEIDQNEIKSWWDRNKSEQYLPSLTYSQPLRLNKKKAQRSFR